jgi:hypothetical protein
MSLGSSFSIGSDCKSSIAVDRIRSPTVQVERPDHTTSKQAARRRVVSDLYLGRKPKSGGSWARACYSSGHFGHRLLGGGHARRQTRTPTTPYIPGEQITLVIAKVGDGRPRSYPNTISSHPVFVPVRMLLARITYIRGRRTPWAVATCQRQV